MSNEEAELFLWIFGILGGLIGVCFILYLIGDHFAYSGGSNDIDTGTDDGSRHWPQL